MTSHAAERLLAQPTDFDDQSRTFAEYTHGAAEWHAAPPRLVFDLGWITWRLRSMLRLIATVKDVDSIDRLEHHQPTYDAWYEYGVFFVQRGRWSYVGAGPMVDAEHIVGPEDPQVSDVKEWVDADPVATHVELIGDGLSIETLDGAQYRCEQWDLPPPLIYTLTEAPKLTSGGARLRFATGEEIDTAVFCVDRTA